MARIVTKQYLLDNPDVLELMKKSVFVYPTDTIYGIGCDATNEELVARVRAIKQREEVPFSIVTPTKKLIETHCDLTPKAVEWLAKLPGPYTIVLPVQKAFVAKNVSFDGKSIGVRMLSNWFQDIVTQWNIPVITTSVNYHGKPYMTSIKNIDVYIKKEVDFIIDDGNLNGRPSQLVNLMADAPIERPHTQHL